MKLLILSFYFRPDLSAGSFRTAALVKSLLAARADLEIEVVTTLPNRYGSFSSEAETLEQSDRLTVHRIRLPKHNSGMLDQARAFVSFAHGTGGLTKSRRYDLIYATSSRLMTAVLGAHLSQRLAVPLYLDLRDIFVDTIKDVLPRFAPVAQPLFSAIERWAVTHARSVNLVSGGFEGYFRSRYPGQRLTFFTNGIDDEFLPIAAPLARAQDATPLTVLYAGNIGEGQGLHAILPELARRMSGQVRFRVVGDGGRRVALEEALRRSRATNVEILRPVSRSRLIAEYREADVLFLHLNDYDAFRKVLPSKIFEYAATGKPIWAGLAGYPAEFAGKEIGNLTLFPPCDVAAAIAAFASLKMGPTQRSAFVAKYARTAIMRGMAADILSVAEG